MNEESNLQDKIIKLEKELKFLRRYRDKYPNGANGCCCLFDDDYNQIVWCMEHAELRDQNKKYQEAIELIKVASSIPVAIKIIDEILNPILIKEIS